MALLHLLKTWILEHKISSTLALLVFLFFGYRWVRRHWNPHAAAKSKTIASSPLYTGKEAKRKISLYFGSESQAQPQKEEREIYGTASLTNQAKQAVLALFEGPKTPALVRLFPAEAGLRELFIKKDGLCVVDLNQESSSKHPGGSTAEYLSLFSLVRALTDNFPEIKRVQVLVQGERVETLAGHYDLSGPLDSSAF